MTSTPPSTSAATRSSVPSPMPTAAPTRSLPCWSFDASGCSLDLRMSFTVIRPRSSKPSRTTSTRSRRCLCRSARASSGLDPSLTYTSLSRGVIMTPRDRLVYVKEGSSPEEARALLHKHRLERVLVVRDGFELRGLITVKDILKSSEHPDASKDQQGKLRVGAAVGIGEGTEERVAALVEGGVDVIVVDTAHGHSQGVLDRLKWIKRNAGSAEVIGGNIATADGAKALVDHGADAVKVGIGPGSICTTRIVAGVGVPQISAVENVAKALAKTDVPLIADGGVRFS